MLFSSFFCVCVFFIFLEIHSVVSFIPPMSPLALSSVCRRDLRTSMVPAGRSAARHPTGLTPPMGPQCLLLSWLGTSPSCQAWHQR